MLWDGLDLRDMGIGELHERISVVLQDFMTYELSADNIAVGDLSRAARLFSLQARGYAGEPAEAAGRPHD
jgi:hypothetical protein